MKKKKLNKFLNWYTRIKTIDLLWNINKWIFVVLFVGGVLYLIFPGTLELQQANIIGRYGLYLLLGSYLFAFGSLLAALFTGRDRKKTAR